MEAENESHEYSDREFFSMRNQIKSEMNPGPGFYAYKDNFLTGKISYSSF